MVSGAVQVNGFWWPKKDRDCRAVVFDSVVDMLPALALTEGRKVAVQAGGNCGVWAAWLAERFEKVITFEPDHENFACLVENVPANVSAVNAGLGLERGRYGMVRDPANIGAHYISDDGEDSIIVRLDDTPFEFLDYLCLDIEGHEMPALLGAAKTIQRHRPVIQLEDKGLSERYGYKKGDAENWLAKFGYTVRCRIARDVILAC